MTNFTRYIGLVGLLAVTACGKHAPPTPRTVDRISDPGSHLVYFRDELKYDTDSWNKELGIDLHIVDVDQDSVDIVEQARQIFQSRKIGQHARTGGILILINSKTSEARIAVSHNLETVFTDAVVGSIAKSQLAPYASYNMSGMAVMDTLHFLKDHLLSQVALGTFELDKYYREQPGNKSILSFYSGGGGASTHIPTVDFNSNWKRRPDDADMVKYSPKDDPMGSAESFMNVLKDMIGYPELPLFTDGSQVMRNSYPFAPYEAYMRYLRILKSLPLEIKIQGDRAVALSKKPAHGYQAIMMKQSEGKWKVDLTEMMKNLFFDSHGNYLEVNSNNPYSFALDDSYASNYDDITAIPLPPHMSLQQIINELKNHDVDSAREFMIAELLFRNAYASVESLEHYEKAVSLSPNNEFYRRSLIKRYQYLGMDNLAAAQASHVAAFKRDMADPLDIVIDPERPILHLGAPTKVRNAAVYDYAEYSVTIHNRGFLPMHFKSVNFYSLGNRRKSGLGNIARAWFGYDAPVLGPRQSILFNKVWGFNIDTPNTEMTDRFVFTYTIGDNPKEYVLTKDVVLTPSN